MLIVFDLDGTLADCTHRLHLIQGPKKDFDAFDALCMFDKPVPHMLELYYALYFSHAHSIEIWTGRSDIVREETERWLTKFGVLSLVRMRSERDHTRDVELKESWLLLDKRLGLQAPGLVFEDRQRVVDMWRRNGITCCQVAKGDF